MPFQVIFEGLKENNSEQREFVKNKLIEKFKVPTDKAERMIASAPIVVKKGLTQDQANKYKAALDSIGAIASVQLVADETDKVVEQTPPTPIAQAPIPPKAVQTKPTEVVTPETNRLEDTAIESAPTEIKISESKPLPPLFEVQQAPPKSSALEDSYPVFFEAEIQAKSFDPLATVQAPSDPLATRQTAPTLDPYKTKPEMPELTKPIDSKQEAVAPVTPTTKVEAGIEWWKTVKVLNTPFDESVKGVTPISSGRISANDYGFSISHPMIERIAFNDVQLISSFQTGGGSNPRLFIDIFIASNPRPIRLDLDLMNFSTFGVARPEDPAERLATAATALVERNKNVVIDLATYKLLKDKTKIKIVPTDRDIEKYCGKLQLEVEKGLTQEANSNIISCKEASELLSTNDPWVSAPPPAYPFPGQVPPTLISPAPGMPPGNFGAPGMPPARPGMPQFGQQNLPPGAYTTQPMKPGATTPNLPNQTQMPMPPNPPMRGQYPTQQQYPPANNPYASPAPPAFGQQPQPMPYTPPQNQYGNQPYAPPMPGRAPFPSAPPMPGQMPVPYQGQYPSAPGQLPVSSPLGQGFADPSMSREVNKAFEDAQSALIFSIVGFVCTCLMPLSIVGLIKAQNAIKILDKYGVQENRNKALAAKIISIFSLVVAAIGILLMFLGK